MNPPQANPSLKQAQAQASGPLHGLIQTLDDRRLALLAELDSLGIEDLQARPAPETWSLLEIVEHVVVAEKVILLGLPPRAELVVRPRNLGHRVKRLLVSLVLRWGIPVKVPSRRMLPTGQRSLAELRQTWDEHLHWLRRFAEGPASDAHLALFTHPVAGPISLVQALQMDLLHLQTHQRQIAKRRQAQPSHAT